MAITEAQTLDMSAILMRAYDLGDMIKLSAETADYLYWKQRKDNDPEAAALVKLLQKKKELFEECQRFGHFHPDYHAALEQVQNIQDKLDAVESVRQYKKAEQRLDDLLYNVSQLIAHSVSETIKVPSNDPLASGGGCSSGSCSTGGSCSGDCG
ncbi:YlbF family regulator [Paenibacillus xerothermodurans]|uniref:YlbF family regulator n=1 Tax=Paenibacillus xerothermodurans TaxID=1977292 RepID=A0A2W1NDE9_PAEXE|nr:YlbF family regulator [Paenibacillus xerothermodurans]PZE22537.1 YlbF family regulator [Paenibacillus xerothermodurans]